MLLINITMTAFKCKYCQHHCQRQNVNLYRLAQKTGHCHKASKNAKYTTSWMVQISTKYKNWRRLHLFRHFYPKLWLCWEIYHEDRGNDKLLSRLVRSERRNCTSSIVWDLPRLTPHFCGYQWSNASVVIQFSAVAHDDHPACTCLQRLSLRRADPRAGHRFAVR